MKVNNNEPPQVQPSPVPTSIAIARVTAKPQDLVALQIATPVGVNVFFLDLATARGISEMLANATSPISVVQSLADLGIGRRKPS